MTTSITLSDLVDAVNWVSGGGAEFGNAAYLCRTTGRVWRASEFGANGDTLPDDLEDDARYLQVPDQHDLNLGKHLALRFAQAHLPDSYEKVCSLFRKAGAWGRFKQMLEQTGQLDAWHAFETQGISDVLREWAADNGFEVTQQA